MQGCFICRLKSTMQISSRKVFRKRKIIVSKDLEKRMAFMLCQLKKQVDNSKPNQIAPVDSSRGQSSPA